jgi:hypothetical protein
MFKLQRGSKSLATALVLGLGLVGSSQGADITTKDKVKGYIGMLQGATGFAPASERPNGKASDFAIDFTTAGGGLALTNANFMTAINQAASNDVLTVSFWVKKYDNANSSTFWIASPSAAGRAFQAHTPWDNGGGVYFDTAGCCDGGLQRINGPISDFPGYTDPTWWNGWHHWVFFKNVSDKQVWVDGQLFLQGENTAPLPTDNTGMWLGMNDAGGNLMHGVIDDFAVYTNALIEADIQKLFTGTPPDQLGGANYLLAYWSFDDAPVFGPATGTPLGFTITANDVGANVMDTNSIVLGLNGSPVAPTSIIKTNTVTYITHMLANPPFPSGSTQTVNLTIKDKGGNTFTTTASFVVSVFSTLTANMVLPADSVNRDLRGFKIRTFQVDDPAVGNGVQVAEDILAGKYGTNVANLDDLTGVDAKGYFSFPGVINLDVVAGGMNGRFTDPDYPPASFPGIPGFPQTALPTERFACEVLTALEFTAPGLYTMVVNSDDCFATASGPNPVDLFGSVALGRFDSAGGRGAADTSFQFFVEKAGLYGFRTVYQQGGGGGNLEWFMVNPDGTRGLLNDVTNALSAFQWTPTITAAYVKTIVPADKAVAADPTMVQAVIVDGSTPVNQASISLKLDGAPVTATPVRAGNETTVTYLTSPLLAPKSTHTATLSFLDGANTVTREWSFTVAPYTKDLLQSYVGTLAGATTFSTSGGGFSGKAGDYAIDFGRTSGTFVHINRAGEFLNVAAAQDEMTFSIWIKKHDNANSSVFWANALTAAGNRGWQAHAPWGTSIYFDTAGCCGGDTRINADISSFPGYTGNVSWWTNWHHFVFQKKADYKAIWIDGQMFLEGAGANPLTVDFTDMWLGRDAGGDYMHGLVDDFAVFATALGTNDVTRLAAGATPTTLDTSARLLAYWNFDDAPVGPSQPSISIALVSGKPTLTFTGKLQSCETVNGTYADVSGATSPYTIDTTKAAQLFYRAKQ